METGRRWPSGDADVSAGIGVSAAASGRSDVGTRTASNRKAVMIGPPGCRVVRCHDRYEGKQGMTYGVGISAQTSGSQALCLHTLVLPAGAHGKAHLHEHHESAIYIVEGDFELWSGEDLAQYDVVSAGDFIYIPAGTPPARKPQQRRLLHRLVARTDPNEQERVVLLPDLDARAGRGRG